MNTSLSREELIQWSLHVDPLKDNYGSERRFQHCLSVADTAERLARMYDTDPIVARLAGRLHDWAKFVPIDEADERTRAYLCNPFIQALVGLSDHEVLSWHLLDSTDQAPLTRLRLLEQLQSIRDEGSAVLNPILHAPLAADFLQQRHPCLPEEILQSIALHPVGAPYPSDVDMIIVIADSIEPLRKEVPGLKDLQNAVGTCTLKELYIKALSWKQNYHRQLSKPYFVGLDISLACARMN